MSASFSPTSLRSFGSSKSLASFVDELSAATRFAEVTSTGAAARSTRRRARPDSSVLPDHMFEQHPSIDTVAPVPEDECEAASTVHRRRVRPESILPGMLFAKPTRVAAYGHEDKDDETEITQVAAVGARRRCREFRR
ncbi:hypothetical protein AURDEDRAFT_162540 [Auricularia subglabra TFB-10046 SS5]|nr:hypothetical protein AURDEDRAFT_162540 [Auricularia subglabra TFB-10046 SS5]